MTLSPGPSFDQLLEQALNHTAAANPGASILPEAAKYHGVALGAGLHVPFLSHLFVGLSTKTAAGLALASVVVGGGVAAAAVNGSPNPLNWGHQVTQQVALCKAEFGPSATASTSPLSTPTPTPATSTPTPLPLGVSTATPTASPTPKNVGQCVSAFAKQHGKQERALHAHGKGRPSLASPTSRPNGKPTGKPSGRPTPHHATGKPSGLPAAVTGKTHGKSGGHHGRS